MQYNAEARAIWEKFGYKPPKGEPYRRGPLPVRKDCKFCFRAFDSYECSALNGAWCTHGDCRFYKVESEEPEEEWGCAQCEP